MTGRRSLVSCLHCKRIVAMAGGIADPELDQLRAHLLACCPAEVAGSSPSIAATLRHFRVEPEPEPPDAA